MAHGCFTIAFSVAKYYLHNNVVFFKLLKLTTFKNYFSDLSVNLLKSITQFIIRTLCLPWCMSIVFHHINYRLIWGRQPDVFTFMAVNNNNKRHNCDNSWKHIEVCIEKWCYVISHQVCSNSNTTDASSGTGTGCPSGTLNACYDFE